MKLSRLILASGNAGKLRELSAMLAPHSVEVVSQRSLGIADAEEPWPTFIENALAKARHASGQGGAPALADDSGICVDALGGAPGVRSARYAADGGLSPSGDADADNNRRLIAELDALGVAEEQRTAAYYCVLVLVRGAEDPCPLIAEGWWRGRIVRTPRGSGGFGYDAHFLLPGLGRTAAELDSALKNELSHRALAMRGLLARLGDAGMI